ncbi:Glutathione S-transferase [hydrothermal vent metagenome]|uniref:Glutathione S-transferase n=1 Tax=hydrothermal vent metagenome TaxID=652676 RepID=A0A3B1AAE0_9ZZZZ
MANLILIIGNKNYSSWSLRPWIFMRYFKIPFDEKRIALFTDTMEPDLAMYGSDTKVPVLQDGDRIIWDSLAILDYVSEQYLEGKGWPQNINARALARSICAEMHSSFFHLREALPMNCRKRFRNHPVASEAQREINRIKDLWKMCREKYTRDGRWLFGNFSIADAMYAPIALRFSGYDIALNDDDRAYVDTIISHPDVQEWIDAGKTEPEVIELDEIELAPDVVIEHL